MLRSPLSNLEEEFSCWSNPSKHRPYAHATPFCRALQANCCSKDTVDPGPSSSCMEKVLSHRRLRRMNQSRQGHDQKLEQTVELLLEKLKTAPQPGFERRSSPRRRARRIGRRASL